MLVRTQSTQVSQTPLKGMQCGSIILQKCLAVSYKVKHALSVPTSNPTPRYLYKKNENMFIQRLVPEFHSNIIKNSLKLEKSNSPLTDE